MPTIGAGGRRVSVAALAARQHRVEPERGISRKDLSEAARDAGKALALRPTLRLALDALVSVYGETNLEGQLMVWPSNAWMMTRTGLSERALRYALRELTELNVIAARDSANGKRYARRDKKGEIVEAFGFDLAPLYVRRIEFAETTSVLDEQRRARAELYDHVTIARRRVEAALSALPCPSDDDLERYRVLVAQTPRRSPLVDPTPALRAWCELADRLETILEETGNAGRPCRHKETDNEPISEPCHKASDDCEGDFLPDRIALVCRSAVMTVGKPPRTTSDLIEGVRLLRPYLGAHPSIWTEALEMMDPGMAAATVWVVTERVERDQSGPRRIANPGGYLRAVLRLVARNQMSIADELAIMKENGGTKPPS